MTARLPADDPVAAIAANHRSWFLALAVASGAPVHLDGDLVLAGSAAPDGESQLPFPHLDPTRAGEQIDAALVFARAHRPTGSLLAWATGAPDPRHLGVRLMARGLRRSFRPHWMFLDLGHLSESSPHVPGLVIRQAPDPNIWDNAPHPYFGASDSPATCVAIRAESEAASADPQHTVIAVAHLDGHPVGSAAVHITEAVAGVYNVGVLPEYRNRGIGGATTAAVCRLAQERGARYAGLNATPLGEPVYRRLGFVSRGWGQTWIAPTGSLAQPPVASAMVAWTEAIGFGDGEALEARGCPAAVVGFDTPLPCGLTPIQFAASTGQPAAAAWLVAHGATLDPLSAWDLGWGDHLPSIVAADPTLRRFPTGESGGTALHEAVLRDDADLLFALLEAGADPTVPDSAYQSPPIGWAEHLGRRRIAGLLRQHADR